MHVCTFVLCVALEFALSHTWKIQLLSISHQTWDHGVVWSTTAWSTVQKLQDYNNIIMKLFLGSTDGIILLNHDMFDKQ